MEAVILEEVVARDYAPTEIKIPMYVTAIIFLAMAVVVYNARYVFARIPAARRKEIDPLPYLRHGMTYIAIACASMAVGFTLISIGNDSVGSILSNTDKVMISDTYTENVQWLFYGIASIFLTKSMSQYWSQSESHADNAVYVSAFAGLMMFLIWTTASVWGLLMYSVFAFGCICVLIEWFIQNRAVAMKFSWKMIPSVLYVFWWITPLFFSIITSPTVGWWSEVARMWVLNGVYTGLMFAYVVMYVPAFRRRRQRWPGWSGTQAMYGNYQVENRSEIMKLYDAEATSTEAVPTKLVDEEY